MKTKVDIFSGFLGSGKTSLIKKLIDEKLNNENIVIIENEFGEIGVDGSILRKKNIKVKEINAGCICCTSNGDFKNAIKEVLDKFTPERIIIEPSGVGKLSEVLSILTGSELKDKIIINIVVTVVDAIKYELYAANFDEFYKNQIINAKTIILSRTQNAKVKNIESVIAAINKLNSKCNVITTPWDKISSHKIIEITEQNSKQSVQNQVNLIKKPIRKINMRVESYICHHADEIFNTWGIETSKVFDKQGLIEKLKSLDNNQKYGTVLRAKGIVQVEREQWIQFDYVPDEIQVIDIDADYTGRLCIIGDNLNKENIKKMFLE